jgi:hypothetical protein
MLVLQLSPRVPLMTPKGAGEALIWRDYGPAHDDWCTVLIASTNEIWTFRNSEVRGVENMTAGRTASKAA